MSPVRLIATVCAAQVLTQVAAYALPAILPILIHTWSLSNTEAGWITGIYYAAYTLAVPLLVSLTDLVEPRRIYGWGVGLLTCSYLGFAVVADGFWGALACRVLAGAGWAGTYMRRERGESTMASEKALAPSCDPTLECKALKTAGRASGHLAASKATVRQAPGTSHELQKAYPIFYIGNKGLPSPSVITG
jgi:hypothetical protein